MDEIANFKMRIAEFQLIRSLWAEARIWPYWLKKAGPLGGL